MKWPWDARVKKAEDAADHAVEQAEDAEKDWPLARAVAGEARRQRVMNGWTNHMVQMFGGHQIGRHRGRG